LRAKFIALEVGGPGIARIVAARREFSPGAAFPGDGRPSAQGPERGNAAVLGGAGLLGRVHGLRALIQALASLFLVALFVVPGLDRRFHVSAVAIALVLSGCEAYRAMVRSRPIPYVW
jgi:hypothetical protein